ncbi:MAG TPA: hypothetical protein VGJ90_06215 [Methylophilaceae bacterium]|jgi:hypothetical protein
MSTNANEVSQLSKLKTPNNQGYISGRIISQRKIKTQQGNLFLTVLRLPSPSEYDHPATVELRSSESLGLAGDDWQGHVRLHGMSNVYDTKSTDTETGEVSTSTIRSARNEFTVL